MYDLITAIHHQAQLVWLYQRFELLLKESKEKYPDKDFTENEKIIKIIKDFELIFLETVEENRLIDKRLTKLIIQNESLRLALEKANSINDNLNKLINEHKSTF